MQGKVRCSEGVRMMTGRTAGMRLMLKKEELI